MTVVKAKRHARPKARQKAPKPYGVKVTKVDREVWVKAMELANADIGRIVVRNEREVVVVNHPQRTRMAPRFE